MIYNKLLIISLKKEQSCKRLEVTAHQIYIGLHTHTWIHNCVIKIAGCGKSHRYTNIQIYSVKYYKHLTKTVPGLIT